MKVKGAIGKRPDGADLRSLPGCRLRKQLADANLVWSILTRIMCAPTRRSGIWWDE